MDGSLYKEAFYLLEFIDGITIEEFKIRFKLDLNHHLYETVMNDFIL
jgi:hypothetical protein